MSELDDLYAQRLALAKRIEELEELQKFPKISHDAFQ